MTVKMVVKINKLTLRGKKIKINIILALWLDDKISSPIKGNASIIRGYGFLNACTSFYIINSSKIILKDTCQFSLL